MHLQSPAAFSLSSVGFRAQSSSLPLSDRRGWRRKQKSREEEEEEEEEGRKPLRWRRAARAAVTPGSARAVETRDRASVLRVAGSCAARWNACRCYGLSRRDAAKHGRARSGRTRGPPAASSPLSTPASVTRYPMKPAANPAVL